MSRFKNLFYKLQGVKPTLDLKRVYAAIAICFGVFVLFQLCLPEESSHASREPISVPNLSSETVIFPEIAEKHKIERSNGEIAKKEAKKPSLSTGPEFVLRPRNLNSISAGTVLEAILVVGASNGIVKAKTKDRLVIAGETVIESGTVFIGQGNSTEERLYVTFNQALFKDGSIAQINAQACDASDKIVGLKGSQTGRKALALAGAIGLNFAGGLSEGFQESQGQQGVVVKKPGLQNALLHATALTAFDQSKNLMSDLKDRRPLIEVPSDTSFLLIFGGN